MALVPAYAGDAAAAQTKDQQKCTNAMNKDGQKAAAGAAKDIQSCVKSFAKAKGVTDLDGCVAGLAGSGGKYDKAASKTGGDWIKKCPDELDKNDEPKRPPYGVSDPNTINAAALAMGQAIIVDIFGSDVALSETVRKEDPDKDISKCQQTILKDVYKCQDTVMKEFNGCKKNGLKDGDITDPNGIEGCIGVSPKGKITKACVTKIKGDIEKKCIGKDVDPSEAFPGCNTDDVNELQVCLETKVRCLTCGGISTMDALKASCSDCGEPIGSDACVFSLDESCIGGDTPGASCEDEVYDSDCPGGGDCRGVSSAVAHNVEGEQLDLSMVGQLDIDCGVPNPIDGIAPCECRISWSDPIDLSVIGVACIMDDPSIDCAGGQVDCDGGTPLSKTFENTHNLGWCGLYDDPNADPSSFTGPSECEAMCRDHCAALPGKYKMFRSGCEGYCFTGPDTGQMCTFNVECTDGACWGLEAQGHRNHCGCECLELGGAPSGPGAVECEIPLYVVVENEAPCGDGGPVIFMESTNCVPFTTEVLSATIFDADEGGGTIGPIVTTGSHVSCEQMAQGDVEGFQIVGNNLNFDTGFGDLSIAITVLCQ
jgi:hypothetical protein